MTTRMQQRRGTAAEWAATDPILAGGEIGFETDTAKFKIGDGSTTWLNLRYFVNIADILDGAPSTLDTLNELAAAINDDPDFFNSIVSDFNLKADLDSPSFTGTVDFSAATLQGIVLIPEQAGNTGKYLTTNGSVISWADVDAFPDQAGNSGKYLTTDGSNTSWADVDAFPDQTGNEGSYLTTDGTTTSWSAAVAPRPHPFMMLG